MVYSLVDVRSCSSCFEEWRSGAWMVEMCSSGLLFECLGDCCLCLVMSIVEGRNGQYICPNGLSHAMASVGDTS